MPTNYYVTGRFVDGSGEGLHIGQTAAGWRFLFRAHPGHGLTTGPDWIAFLRENRVTIRNEYGREVSVDEMEKTITETEDAGGRLLRPRFRRDSGDHYIDSAGHAFSRVDFC